MLQSITISFTILNIFCRFFRHKNYFTFYITVSFESPSLCLNSDSKMLSPCKFIRTSTFLNSPGTGISFSSDCVFRTSFFLVVTLSPPNKEASTLSFWDEELWQDSGQEGHVTSLDSLLLSVDSATYSGGNVDDAIRSKARICVPHPKRIYPMTEPTNTAIKIHQLYVITASIKK